MLLSAGVAPARRVPGDEELPAGLYTDTFSSALAEAFVPSMLIYVGMAGRGGPPVHRFHLRRPLDRGRHSVESAAPSGSGKQRAGGHGGCQGRTAGRTERFREDLGRRRCE